MGNRGAFSSKPDEYYTTKYAEIIRLWDSKEQPSAIKISEQINISASAIYAIIARLRNRGLIGGHAVGRPCSRPFHFSRTVWDAVNNPTFKRNFDFTPLYEAAARRGISHSRLIRKIVVECLECPSLIDNILDDADAIEAKFRKRKEAAEAPASDEGPEASQ